MARIQRVRGLIVHDDHLLLIKRVRPGRAPYWVTPGGGVEATDASPEAALHREVMEELGATIEILRLVLLFEHRWDAGAPTQQAVFLCRLLSRDPALRHGPEYDGLPHRGEYIAEAIPLAPDIIRRLPILPESLGRFLAEHADHLFDVPELRRP